MMKWLNRDRITNYPWMFIIVYLGIGSYAFLEAIFWGKGIDIFGKPVGADFVVYWVVSAFCLGGEPSAVYDFTKLNAAIKDLGGIDYYQTWNYSPCVLLMVLPVALLPYIVSLLLWLSITLSGALYALRRIAPHPATIKLALAFPGTFQNFMQGQNGFISGGFLGGGLFVLDRSPVLGGFLLGLMSYKPHLAILIPVALIGGKRWKALATATVTVAGLIILSCLFFGIEIWVVYLKYLSSVPPKLLDISNLWPKMVTTLASVRLVGGNEGMAWLLQGAVTACAVGVVFLVWRHSASPSTCASVLILGTLLATPYAFDYDLFILSLPIAWMAWEGTQGGWNSQKKLVLFFAWLSPFIIPVLARETGFQLGPIVFASMIVFLIRRRS